MQIEEGLYFRLKHIANQKQIPLYDLVHTYLNMAVSYEEWITYHDQQRWRDLQDTLEGLIIAAGAEPHGRDHSHLAQVSHEVRLVQGGAETRRDRVPIPLAEQKIVACDLCTETLLPKPHPNYHRP